MQITTHKTMSAALARAYGFVSLTSGYSPGEMHMARRVLEDLRRGGIDGALVQTSCGVEVWRERGGMAFTPGNERE